MQFFSAKKPKFKKRLVFNKGWNNLRKKKLLYKTKYQELVAMLKTLIIK